MGVRETDDDWQKLPRYAERIVRNVINWIIDRLDFTGKTAKRMQALLTRLGLEK
jgi:hypothetical protein